MPSLGEATQRQQTTIGPPAALAWYLGTAAPAAITAIGDLALLDRAPVALFCSVQCPGQLILQLYDLAERLRAAAVPVIGGFHAPMERECLTLLLRGPGPVVVCLARGLEGMRLPPVYRRPLAEGRLLLLSPFHRSERRATAEMALLRNRVVAGLAGRVVVAHAAPGGKTEALCQEVVGWRKPLYTLAGPANAHLVALGAQPLTPESAVAALTAPL